MSEREQGERGLAACSVCGYPHEGERHANEYEPGPCGMSVASVPPVDARLVLVSRDRLRELEAERERLRHAVEFYASPRSWVYDDSGDCDGTEDEGRVARRALGGDDVGENEAILELCLLQRIRAAAQAWRDRKRPKHLPELGEALREWEALAQGGGSSSDDGQGSGGWGEEGDMATTETVIAIRRGKGRHVVSCRLTAQEWRALEAEASARGLKRSDVLRLALERHLGTDPPGIPNEERS